MDFKNINQKIGHDDIVLKPISETDRAFINGLFCDEDIKRYYIVPKEAQQDCRKVVDYWLNDIRNAAGTCWVIIKKGSGIFSKDNQVGFIAFEFRGTLKNVRVSYAILPQFRGKGFATTGVNLVIEKLKSEGVEQIEADIDKDNINSERVVEKLGFSTNKRQALIDPEMKRDGEIRIRFLWKKELTKKEFETNESRIPLNASIEYISPIMNSIVDKINSEGQHPKLLVRYFYLLGRIKYIEKNFEEAQQAFGQCNMIAMNEGLPQIHETYYWFAKINEAKGEIGTAKMYYNFALENYNDNPDYITKIEIEREMSK